jgi:hypothetical protein
MALPFTFYWPKKVTWRREIQSFCIPGRRRKAEHKLISSTVVLNNNIFGSPPFYW